MLSAQRFIIGLALPLLILGCGKSYSEAATGEPVTQAIVMLHAVGNSGVTGVVHFTQAAGGVKVEAHLNGLTPGDHGFHIHQYGDCNAPDGTSAGGHFNPAGVKHGSPSDDVHHVGDLGNLSAADDGHGMMMDQFFAGISLSGPGGIIGRAVIIHSGADDMISQPTGAAGSRVACGVIGIAKAR